MVAIRTCKKCGGSLNAFAPEGLCPKCMLLSALDLAREEDGSAGTARPTFGDYELLEEVGRGGMGVVYKARQISLNRVVALKMMQAQQLASAAQVQRFHMEAEAAANLSHPNIVAIHEIGEHAGQHFFSMEHIEGPSLAQVICDLRFAIFDFKRAARYVKSIAEAIHYAHQRGVLHRDLKPSNILIDANGQPRVTDFGLAKRFGDNSTLTLTGEVLGSPSYMAPEQATSPRQVTTAVDIYSLGGILYELLTGRPPFAGTTPAETLHRVLDAELAPLRPLNPLVPRDLETICRKCLEKDPQQRYRTAEELADDLTRFLRDEPIIARPVGQLEKSWRWARRNPIVAVLSGVTLALLLVVAIGSPIAAWRIQRAREIAEERAYSSDMNLVQQALEVNNVGRAERLLNRHRPTATSKMEKDGTPTALPSVKAGWEWRYLWRQCQSDALFTLSRKSNAISSLAVSHDGKWIAVGENSKGRLSVWDVQSRGEIARLPAGEYAVHVAFSPREPLLAFSVETGRESTNRHDSVRLWDGRTGKIVNELPLAAWCRGLAFSEDGQILITSTLPPENQFILWKLPEGRKLASYPAPRTLSAAVRFAATRDLAFAAHVIRERVRVVNLISGQEQWTAAVEDEKVSTLCFSPDGKILATGADAVEPLIRLWDTASGKELGTLRGHSAYIFDLIFWPDGNTLASASADQTIRLWDLIRLRPLHTLRGNRNELWRLALLPDRKTLVSGCKDGTVCLWDTTTVPSERQVFTVPVAARAWGFAPDSKSVLTIDRDGRLQQWQGTEFQRAQQVLELGPRIHQACISGDGRLIAAGHAGGIVRIWDLQRRSVLREFQGSQGPVRPWRFSARSTTVVTTQDGTDRYQEWDVTTGQEKRSWRGAQNWSRGALSADGRWCFTRGVGGTALLNDLLTGREVNLHLDPLQLWDGAFSPDSRLFAAASSFGFCKLWETDTFREVATLGGFLQGVHSVVFSPDGKRLAAGSNAKEAIKIWDVDSQLELLTLQGQGARFSSCAFSPDGNVLGALNADGVLHLWVAPSWAEILAAETK